MPYITPDYYKNVYKGAQAPSDTDLERYIERASDVIDEVTEYKLYGGKFEALPEGFVKDLVRKATAAQVEFYVIKGGDAAVNAGEASGMNSVSVGSFSYSGGGSSNSSGASSRDAGRISPATLSILNETGLLYRGVFVRG
ncbi:head-tail connector protein [Bacillus licheniformis]|uniref:hypothetical protein n=1 Tax=Bacillus licheniformis TaxID=1402 RepID=UPI002DB961C2|nr:hypothetical protein [Bacillus licheniformis]MEC1351691.1 hypothetical protein [Bacillus licheniformis]